MLKTWPFSEGAQGPRGHNTVCSVHHDLLTQGEAANKHSGAPTPSHWHFWTHTSHTHSKTQPTAGRLDSRHWPIEEQHPEWGGRQTRSVATVSDQTHRVKSTVIPAFPKANSSRLDGAWRSPGSIPVKDSSASNFAGLFRTILQISVWRNPQRRLYAFKVMKLQAEHVELFFGLGNQQIEKLVNASPCEKNCCFLSMDM